MNTRLLDGVDRCHDLIHTHHLLLARRRNLLRRLLGTSEWWVCGPVEPDAVVDLDEVHRLYADNDLWDRAFAR